MIGKHTAAMGCQQHDIKNILIADCVPSPVRNELGSNQKGRLRFWRLAAPEPRSGSPAAELKRRAADEAAIPLIPAPAAPALVAAESPADTGAAVAPEAAAASASCGVHTQQQH